MKVIKNKLAVVTGASKGIGLATCIELAKANYDLIICARDEVFLKLAIEKILNANANTKIYEYAVDVSNAEQLKGFIEKIKAKFDSVDVLVNNAGLFIPGNILDEQPGALEKMLATNLISVYNLTRGLLPLIKNSSCGYIFNLGSVAGTRAYNNGGSYSISKFALHGFSQNLREELKLFNIKVTTVIPGATWSASWEGFEAPHERLMQADDIAKMMIATLHLSNAAVVETITLRPQLGDL